MADGKTEATTSVAKITEISARSSRSFEHAIQIGIERATTTLRNVSSAWVKEQRVEIRDNQAVSYQVNLLITFTLDE